MTWNPRHRLADIVAELERTPFWRLLRRRRLMREFDRQMEFLQPGQADKLADWIATKKPPPPGGDHETSQG